MIKFETSLSNHNDGKRKGNSIIKIAASALQAKFFRTLKHLNFEQFKTCISRGGM